MGEILYSGKDSDPEVRADAVGDTILKNCGFKFLEELGCGTYGNVLKVCDTESRLCKAAKVIIPGDALETEMLIWSSLSHRNIVPAEGAKLLSDGTLIIIMPLQLKSLDRIIDDQRFVHHSNSFWYIRRWLLDSLEGLDYMHRNRFCHLDFKLDNILISHGGTAMVCDFSFANYTSHLLQDGEIGLPGLYRPPELFIKGSEKVKVGTHIDAWSFGLVVSESLTRECLLNRANKCKSWKRDVKPLLKFILDPKVFRALLQDSFTAHSFQVSEVEEALDFIDGFLRIKPEARIGTFAALRHRFMQESEGITVKLQELYSTISV